MSDELATVTSEPAVENTESEIDVNETTVETEVVVEKPNRYDAKFATIHKQNKALKARELELKSKEDKYKTWEDSQESMKTDPLGYLNGIGISYDDIYNSIVGKDESPEAQQSRDMQELKDKINKFEQEKLDHAESVKRNDTEQQFQEGMVQLKEQLSKSTEFDILNATGSYNLVADVLVEHYKKTSEEMDWNKAAGMVESYLEDQEFGRIEKLMKLDKIKKKFGLPEETPELKEQPTRVTRRPISKTMTNRNTSAAPARDKTKLTKEQKRQDAIQLLRKLNQTSGIT